MNDSMSLGVHRLWKDSFVSTVLPRLPPSYHQNPNVAPDVTRPPNTPFRCLDVAGGTGDVALRILDRAREKYANRDVQVEIVDLNMEMLDEGRKRIAKTLYYNSECQSELHLAASMNVRLTCDQHLRSRSHMGMPSPYPLMSLTTRSTCTLSRLESETAQISLRSCQRRIGCSSPVAE